MSMKPKYEATVIASPLGPLRLEASERGLRAIRFGGRSNKKGSPSNPYLRAAEAQLKEYFSGKRHSFDLEIDPSGTDFQNLVWKALVKIPCGQTASYSEIAEMLGRPKVVRAVGGANNKNPLPIIVPCHRVIGKDGSMVGYAGGLEKKKWLLEHEAKRWA